MIAPHAGTGTLAGCAFELNTQPSHEPSEMVRSAKPIIELVQFAVADSRVQ